MKFGIIKEGKTPPDSRVPLTPAQCARIQEQFDLDIVVEPSPGRCYSDAEYQAAGIQLTEDLEDREVLMGVKEVPIDRLMEGKTYCFFSHTIKKQPYNRELLRTILNKRIRLIDYEVLADQSGRRVIAFGRFAGMVGAHNAIWTYGQRLDRFPLKRMKDYRDYAEARRHYEQLELPPLKIVLTGTGRVGSGAAQVLRDMRIRQVPPEGFLHKHYDEPVFTQLRVHHYIAREDDLPYDTRDFYQNPTGYKSVFAPFYQSADIMINGIFWDHRAPAFFTVEEMQRKDWNIRVIADVTCDIAPDASIPSTIRATTIADPVFGFDPYEKTETLPYQDKAIDMMTIDNLPNELPRDASQAFGEQFIEHVLPEFFQPESRMLKRATVAENGELGEYFKYLEDYVAGRE